MKDIKKYQCRLCEKYYSESDMSDEHYPARSVGNDDIIAFNISKLYDYFENIDDKKQIIINVNDLENELFKTMYPKGRTARTLCRKCNTFLGKYDEAYSSFFKADGHPKNVKGFQNTTKLQIIKSVFGKFLSIPEAQDIRFDFVEFLKDENCTHYSGEWNLYMIKRDFSCDIFGLCDIRTGKLELDEGIVFELSDEKFIYNLLNFKKQDCFKMTNIFDILNNNYDLVEGCGENGGFHGQIFTTSILGDYIDKML